MANIKKQVSGGQTLVLPTTNKWLASDIEILGLGGGGGQDIDPGEKLYSFAVLSDIHMNFNSNNQNCNNDFNRAIYVLNKLDPKFVCIAGDVGYSSKESELTTYSSYVSKANMPFYACTGNHDAGHADNIWNNYRALGSWVQEVTDTHKKSFTIVNEYGDVFIFLSLPTKTSLNNGYSGTETSPYGSESIQWLKKQLQKYAGARIFLFMHFPLSGTSGLGVTDYIYYGFKEDSLEDDEILSAILSIGNVTVFNGHTHFLFQAEDNFPNSRDPANNTYPHINVTKFESNKVAIAHTPSCGYPRDANRTEVARNSITEDDSYSQGWIVDVYQNYIDLRGLEFDAFKYTNASNGTFDTNHEADECYLENYRYQLHTENNAEIINKNRIITSQRSITAPVGESKTIQVALTKKPSKDIKVSIKPSSSMLSVTPGTITLTESNWENGQSITIQNSSEQDGFSFVYVLGDENSLSTFVTVSLSPNSGGGTDEPEDDPGILEDEEPKLDGVTWSRQALIADGQEPYYGGVYSGTYPTNGESDIKYQLGNSDKDTTEILDYLFKLKNLTVASTQTPLYFAPKNSMVTAYIEGTNTLSVPAPSSTGQRGMSASGTAGNYLIGVGDNATLAIEVAEKFTEDTDMNTEVVKGNWVIENVDMVVTGTTVSTLDFVETVTPAGFDGHTPAEDKGITIRGSGAFAINGAGVKLVAQENRRLNVHLGEAKSTTTNRTGSTVTITALEGNLTGVAVTGADYKISDDNSSITFTMPAKGTTVTIQ